MTEPTTTVPLDATRTALLVMDYQAGILDRLPEADALLERCAATLAALRGRGVTVGYVRVAFTDDDIAAVPTTNRLFAARLSAGGAALHADSPATQVHQRLALQPDDIDVRKTRVGSFSTTDLDQQLRNRGVDTLLLAGISTSGVVLSTVRDAADRDYRVVVLSDLCADPEPGVHEFLTTRIFPRQADVLSSAELISGAVTVS